MFDPIQSTLSILGGAGKAGRPLIEAALEAGYTVRALLRHPEQFDLVHIRLTIITGDARNPATIGELLDGSTALISTLGNPKGEHTPILSTVTELILSAMQAAGIRRYITLTSLYDTGVYQPHEQTRLSSKFMQQHFPLFMADRVREYALLQASELDYTYIRVPYLVQGPATGSVHTHLKHMPAMQLTVADLAKFLLEQLVSEQFIKRAPFVGNG